MVVVAVFAFCWGFYYVFSLLEARAYGDSALRSFVWRGLFFVISLVFINSVVNSLFYVFICFDVLYKLRRSLRSVLESVLVDDSELGGLGSSRRRRVFFIVNFVFFLSFGGRRLFSFRRFGILLGWLRGGRVAFS